MVKQGNVKRPVVSLLSTEFIERIVDEAKEVLEKTGIWVENKEILESLGNGGARVDLEKGKALIPKEVVEEVLKSVPASIQFYDRNGNPHMNFEGDNVYFASGGDAVKVWDFDLNMLRTPVTEDQVNYVKLVDALDNIDAQGAALVVTDVPKEIMDRYQIFHFLRYSTKPFFAGAHSKEGFPIIKDLLVTVRGSEQALREKPLAWYAICPSPPLKWSDFICYDLKRCAQSGIPVVITPMPLAGATAPVTMGGCLVQGVAEGLSGVVISQLASPGAPLIWASGPLVFDMRYGTTRFSAIESIMMGLASSEIGKYLGLPTRTYVGCSDAKRPDSQAGLETGIGTILPALAGINLTINSGMLSSESAQSLEKLVIDNEICGMARRLVQGITPRGAVLAEDLLTEGLYEGKHFLLSPATLKWLRADYFNPGPVIDREDAETWMEKGCTTVEQRAKEEVKRILTTHEPEPLNEDIDKELLRIITKDARKYGMSEVPLPSEGR
ncbi:Glycine betaine methyltransferase [subsurface metagenome]